MKSSITIQTPEGVVFSFAAAGPVTRFLAWSIDFLCVAALSSAVGTLCAAAGLFSADIAQALTTLTYFVTSIGYGIIAEWKWRGQTIGKRLFHLRVIDAQALRLQFHQVLIRNLLRFVDMLPGFYLVGGVAALISSRGQRLGDLAADTLVVHHTRTAEPDLDQLMAGKFNSLREHPHLAARLRQRVSPEEARLALQAIIRREELDPAARLEIFHELADHYQRIVPFPEEATEFLTDEQFVRNVVDIVFRTGTTTSADAKLTRQGVIETGARLAAPTARLHCQPGHPLQDTIDPTAER